MFGLRTLLVSLLSLAAPLYAKSSTGDSVLVVLEPSLKRDDFSTFFSNLEGE
jgi:oligosaccharyltransferase complex subunit beta